MLILGYGSIGAAIERRVLPFETHVVRVASKARPDDEVHGVDELPALLPLADIVVVIAPLTPATRHLVDAKFLAAMRDGALLVNVARGGIVDTDALVAELERGRLFAALDVTDPEPPPADHPLWSAPGLLLSPHVGGNTSAFLPRARALVRAQVARFVAGEPVENVVAGPASSAAPRSDGSAPAAPGERGVNLAGLRASVQETNRSRAHRECPERETIAGGRTRLRAALWRLVPIRGRGSR